MPFEIDLATGESTGGSFGTGDPRSGSDWRHLTMARKGAGEAGQAIRTQMAQENGSMEGAPIVHGQGTDILRRLGVREAVALPPSPRHAPAATADVPP